jgi:hypothetical protein
MNRREYIQKTTLFLGYTLTAGSVMNLLSSCEQNSHLNWEPVFFTKSEAAALSAITDTICPKTKTPGANEIGVPQFIDLLVHTLLSKEHQKFYKEGITKIELDTKNQFNKNFVDCTIQEKENILIALDKAAAPMPITMWGKPMEEKPAPITFYRKIKSLTLMAYFTSKKIGKEYLAYDPIPGTFKACIPYHNEPNWTES